MSDEADKIRLKAEVDAGGVRQGTGEIKDAVRDMARDVQASAGAAGKSFEGIGEGAKKGAEGFNRAEANFAAAIQRTTARFEAAGKGARAYQEALIQQRGLDPAKFEPYLAALDRAERAQLKASASLGQMGVSAGQTQAALRQLPAQFTDIFTSLSSGQAPLTVLIQQGGQIKDSFGGIGPALRGVAGAISPTVLGLGALAAAAGVAALSYKAGAAEATEYRKALVLTGNAAGTTVGQLQATAEVVGRTVGGQSKAAEVLSQLAATGRLAAGGFESMAEAAIRLERVGGPAAEKTVASFAKLADDPLKASIELNKSTNFLTVELYKQIKALDEQGKKADAAAVAQRAFYEAGNSRAKELEANLGSIERGWQRIKDKVNEAKDAILSIGRQDTPQQQLSKAMADLDQVQASRTVGRNAGRRQSTFDAEEAAIRQRIEAARLLVYQEGEMAAAQAERAAGVERLITADGKSAKSTKQVSDVLQASIDEAKQWADTITDLQKIEADAAGATEGYSKAQQRLVEFFKTPAFKNAPAERKQLAIAQFEAAHSAEQLAAAQKDVAKALAEGAKDQARYLQDLDKSIAGADRELQQMEEELALITGGKRAREALIQARYDDAAAQAAQNLQAAEARGVGEEEYARLSRLADKLAEVAGKRREVALANEIKDNTEALNRELKAVGDDLRTSLTDAFRRSFEAGGSFGKNFARIVGNELKARLSSALAEVLATQVLGSLGVSALGGSGGGRGNNLMQLGSNASSLYNAFGGGGSLWSAADAYLAGTSYGQALGWSTAVAGTGITGYTGAGLTLAGGTGSGAGLSLAGGSGFGGTGAGLSTNGAWSGMFANEAAAGSVSAGSGAAGSASLGAYAGYAAMIYAAAQLGSSLYNKGFTGSANLQGKGWYEGTLEAGKTDLLRSLGMSDKWAEILGGSVRLNHLFGRSTYKLDETGVTGTLGQGGFAGEQFALYKAKGGVFRSDDLQGQYGAVEETLNRFLGDGARRVLTSVEDYGKALGLPVESLAKVNTDLRIVWSEDGEANLTAIKEQFTRYGDALVAAYGDAVKPLAIYGETTSQTIQRVAGAITGVNSVLDSLGLSALQASIDGGRAAQQLQDAFGGLGNLQQAASGYLQNYYSDVERANLVTGQIGDTLGKFGLALPKTRDELRAMVEAQDKTTQKGAEAIAVLLGVADAFAQVVPAGRSAADILAEKSQLELELLTLQGNTTELRARERAAIDDSNRSLYDQIQAQKDLNAAAEVARASEEKAAAAAQEAARAAGAARAQEENEWRAYYDRMEAQASAARQAWLGVWDGIVGEINRLGGVNLSPEATAAGAESAFTLATAQARAGGTAAAAQLPELSRALAEASKGVATSTAELRIMQQRIAASLNETLRITGGTPVPGFAAGGDHLGGLRVVGERGPELEATGPARYFNFDKLKQLADAGGSTAAAVAEQRAVIEEMRARMEVQDAALVAVARNTGRISQQLDEVIRGPLAMNTKAV